MYGQVYTYTVTVTFPYFIHLVEVTILGIAFVRLLVYGLLLSPGRQMSHAFHLDPPPR